MILNVGGGPTPDKPTVTLSVPDPNHINSFMNFRVADIQACYKLWKSRGAEFITEPIPKQRETRCYIRDPDGYIIEVGNTGLILPLSNRGYRKNSMKVKIAMLVPASVYGRVTLTAARSSLIKGLHWDLIP
jgi:hypothetical protein